MLALGTLFVCEAPVVLPAVGGIQFDQRRSACGIVEFEGRTFRALCPGAKAPVLLPAGREAPVLLPAAGGFQFGRRPKVLLAICELFVWARSTLSQERSTCVIARHRRVSIRPKAERFARRSSLSGSGREASLVRRKASVPAVGRFYIGQRPNIFSPQADFNSAEGRTLWSP